MQLTCSKTEGWDRGLRQRAETDDWDRGLKQTTETEGWNKKTNNINIYIDNTRLKEDSFVFEIYLNAERLTSHESVVKTKVIGNVSFKKNGIIQAKSKDFEGLGLSKDFKRSILSATEQAASEFSVDNNFLSKINIISLGE